MSKEKKPQKPKIKVTLLPISTLEQSIKEKQEAISGNKIVTKMTLDTNLKGKALYKFLVANKAALVAEKMYSVKHADPFCFSNVQVTEKGTVVKAAAGEAGNPDEMQVLSVINTTNWLDSHGDVHIPGLWKKSLSEAKRLYLLEEHKMNFRHIISDEIKAFTKKIAWKDLGVDADGYTEALMFDSLLKRSRNEFMFGEYKAEHVHNHSVGMRYVLIELAMNYNSEDTEEEYALWTKYFDTIANRDYAEEKGYFWAVKEAKVVEGSAVPIGSNEITPTISVTAGTGKQPQISTVKQPPRRKGIDYAFLNTKIKL